MKVRFKYQNRFEIFQLNEREPLIKHLIEGASEKFDLNAQTIEISLNAKDFFTFERDSKLRTDSVGLVNGDIVYIRAIGAFTDIKAVLKREIAIKLEDILNETNISFDSGILKKLVLPIHLFMSETGFYIPDVKSSLMDSIYGLQSDVPDKTLLRLSYNYMYNSSSLVALTINLVGIYVCIYGSYSFSKAIYSHRFRSKEFLLQYPAMGQQINQQLPVSDLRADNVYKNLPQFSSSFKNKIAIPLRIDIHLDYSIPTHPFFQILPYEILYRIFVFLDPDSMLATMMTCKRLNDAGRLNSSFWRRLMAQLPQKSLSLEGTSSDDNGENPYFVYQRYMTLQKDKSLKRKSASKIPNSSRSFVYI